jgi:hypothetical protein
MVQKPCTPIRSAKGNPARPLIGGPPLRAHRTQWHGFTGRRWACSIRWAQGRTRGIEQGKASTQPTRAPAPAQGHRTRARARAGRPHRVASVRGKASTPAAGAGHHKQHQGKGLGFVCALHGAKPLHTDSQRKGEPARPLFGGPPLRGAQPSSSRNVSLMQSLNVQHGPKVSGHPIRNGRFLLQPIGSGVWVYATLSAKIGLLPI